MSEYDNTNNLPEIIQDGQKISSERIDPNVMQLIFQAAQTAQMVKLRKLEESKIPLGLLSKSYVATEEVKVIDLDPPWISFVLRNVGPGDVVIRLNELEGDISTEAPISSGSDFSIDHEYPIIKKIYIATTSGSAVVRLFGEQGKWVV